MTDTLIKTKAVKEKAKEYGLLIRNEQVRTNEEFLNEINQLVDSVIFYAIKYQDDIGKKTMVRSEWSARQINKANEVKQEIRRNRGQ